MNEIMISINPKWVEKILNKRKTIEIRKTIPKCELPVKVYIYCTNSKNNHLIRFREYADNYDFKEYWVHTILNNKEIKSLNLFEDDCHLYLNGKVVAEFTLNDIQQYECELNDGKSFESIGKTYYDEEFDEEEIEIIATNEENCYLLDRSCLSWKDLRKYLGKGFNTCYAWKIDDLVVYDKQKKLKEFEIKKAPQSWCYVSCYNYKNINKE